MVNLKVNNDAENTIPWSIQMSESVMQRNPNPPKKWGYEYGVVYKGMEQVWLRTKDQRYFDYIKLCMDAYIEENGNIRTYKPEEYNIDHVNNGKLLFPLFHKTGEEKYKKAAFLLRSQLETHPRTKEGGFWHKKIYPHQMWLDGLYMGDTFYAEFISTFGKPEDYDDVTKQFILIEKYTKDAQTGLLYHGWDESREQEWADSKTGCSKCFWGRAMGWYAMAIVDVLDYLPAEHKDQKKIIQIFNDMVDALIKVQDEESGVWYQVLDQKGREGNYREASASCMFVYSIVKAVRKGYIDSSYLAAARKGFDGILKEFIRIDDQGLVNLENNCEVAGLGKPPNAGAAFKYRDGSFEYYVSEPIVANDEKGIGAFILAAFELESL